MKKIYLFGISLFLNVLFPVTVTCQEIAATSDSDFVVKVVAKEVCCVDRPEMGQGQPLYVGNRQPLEPSPFFKLPVGAVQARNCLF